MIPALLLAALVMALNVGASLAARRWTDRGAKDERWPKAQAAAAASRFIVYVAGLWASWTLTRRPGPLVLYVFTAAVGQMVLQIILLNRNKL